MCAHPSGLILNVLTSWVLLLSPRCHICHSLIAWGSFTACFNALRKRHFACTLHSWCLQGLRICVLLANESVIVPLTVLSFGGMLAHAWHVGSRCLGRWVLELVKAVPFCHGPGAQAPPLFSSSPLLLCPLFLFLLLCLRPLSLLAALVVGECCRWLTRQLLSFGGVALGPALAVGHGVALWLPRLAAGPRLPCRGLALWPCGWWPSLASTRLFLPDKPSHVVAGLSEDVGPFCYLLVSLQALVVKHRLCWCFSRSFPFD